MFKFIIVSEHPNFIARKKQNSTNIRDFIKLIKEAINIEKECNNITDTTKLQGYFECENNMVIMEIPLENNRYITGKIKLFIPTKKAKAQFNIFKTECLIQEAKRQMKECAADEDANDKVM